LSHSLDAPLRKALSRYDSVPLRAIAKPQAGT
jgi:hypothetical protein